MGSGFWGGLNSRNSVKGKGNKTEYLRKGGGQNYEGGLNLTRADGLCGIA